MSRLGAGAAAVVGLLAVALLAPVPPASAAPVLVIVTELPFNYPRQAPLASSGQTITISVVVTSSEPVTVTARSYDGGLTIKDPERSFGALPQPTTISYEVAALQAGFHSFDVQMDGSSGPPYYSVAAGFAFVFATGSPLPPPDPAAAPTEFTAYGVQQPGEAARLLTFVSDDYAYVGLPAFGYPACAQEGGGCLPYWKRSGPEPLVQIGSDIVGTFHGPSGGFYSDGLLPPGPATGTPFGRYDFERPLYAVDKRKLVTGTYEYLERSRTTGMVRQKVTFVKDRGEAVGDYRLAIKFAGGKRRVLEGTFKIGKRSAITFRNARGIVVQRGTIFGTASGESGKRGLWLVLSGRQGNSAPDGNRLSPVT